MKFSVEFTNITDLHNKLAQVVNDLGGETHHVDTTVAIAGAPAATEGKRGRGRPPKAAETAAPAAAAPAPTAAPTMDDFMNPPPAAAPAAAAKPKTIDDVRAALQTVLNMHGAEEARRVLAPFAARIPDVKSEDYDRFIAACEASVKASKK